MARRKIYCAASSLVLSVTTPGRSAASAFQTCRAGGFCDSIFPLCRSVLQLGVLCLLPKGGGGGSFLPVARPNVEESRHCLSGPRQNPTGGCTCGFVVPPDPQGGAQCHAGASHFRSCSPPAFRGTVLSHVAWGHSLPGKPPAGQGSRRHPKV